MDVQKIPKRPPFYIFRNYADFFFSIVSFLRAFVVFSCRKSGFRFRVFLSLRYGADLGRSRLVQYYWTLFIGEQEAVFPFACRVLLLKYTHKGYKEADIHLNVFLNRSLALSSSSLVQDVGKLKLFFYHHLQTSDFLNEKRDSLLIAQVPQSIHCTMTAAYCVLVTRDWIFKIKMWTGIFCTKFSQNI